MEQISGELEKEIQRAWTRASKVLGFTVTAPYLIRTEQQSIVCPIHVAGFGGPHGMAVGLNLPPDFIVNETLIKCAQEAGLSWSFINAELYREFDETVFKDTLIDWGFFGPDTERPSWMP